MGWGRGLLTGVTVDGSVFEDGFDDFLDLNLYSIQGELLCFCQRLLVRGHTEGIGGSQSSKGSKGKESAGEEHVQ